MRALEQLWYFALLMCGAISFLWGITSNTLDEKLFSMSTNEGAMIGVGVVLMVFGFVFSLRVHFRPKP